MTTEVKVTEEDIAKTLQLKINLATNLELQNAALIRTISEKENRILELQTQLDKKELEV